MLDIGREKRLVATGRAERAGLRSEVLSRADAIRTGVISAFPYPWIGSFPET
jgi:hypothetical protein